MISTRNPDCDELFDAVSQSIFAVGLLLEDCLGDTKDPDVAERLDASIESLHGIIETIRTRGEIHCGSACD